MSRSTTKAARLDQIEKLLLTHPEGMTQAELARRLGVNRSTILRNLADLQAPVYEEGWRHFIDRSAYLVNVRFSLHEAMAVHLATRLLATRFDRQNPHAAAALRKLGIALERLAPCISQHLLQSADGMDDQGQRFDPGYLRALEVMTLAWAEKIGVQIWYRKPGGDVSVYRFCPYFVEPGAVGFSTYVIGYAEPPGALRTLKVERIERIETTREGYDIPPDFDPMKLLGDAWGIWYTEGEPVEVTLRFGQRAARRVRETRWHRSEQVSEEKDGSLLWRAWVAEPQEMLPWIRGWGADVEVLAPEELRAELIDEARRISALYSVTSA